ncbi:MAG: helix-hairpin-helix domain-containing protein [Gammaproteobacteria bacterium]
MKQVRSKGLQAIPGVGKSIEVDLQRLGIERIEQLRRRDPQDLYEQMMEQQGGHIDRCMLYVLRCAVYYAEGGREPDKLLWWSWKDT